MYVSSTSTDRLDSPAEPLFLAPKTSTDKLPMQSTVQKHTEATPGDDHPRHRPRSVLLRPNAPTPRPARDRPAIAPCPMIRASCCQCDVPCPPTRDDMSSLTSVTSEAHKAYSSAAQSAPSTPAPARTHPHACWNAAGCAIFNYAAPGQRKIVPPSRRRCHRVVPTRHQRVTGI